MSMAGAYSRLSAGIASMPASPTIGSTSTCARIAVVPAGTARSSTRRALCAMSSTVKPRFARPVSRMASAAAPADPDTRSVKSALSRWMCASTRPGVTSRPATSIVSRAGPLAGPMATMRASAIARSTGTSRSGRRQPRRTRSSTSARPRVLGRRVPAAQDLKGEQQQRREHHQRAGPKDQPAHGLGGPEKPEPSEDVAPVVDQSFGQEGQRPGPPVGRVDPDVGERLSGPEERDGGRGPLTGSQEGRGGDRRDQDLVQRAAEHCDELAEEPEDHVAGFVENQVDAVDEPEEPAALRSQSLRHHLPGEAEQDEETEPPAGDAGESAGVAHGVGTRGMKQGPQASRFGGLML